MRAGAKIGGFLCMWLLSVAAHAHIASNGFLALHVDGKIVTGSYELAVRDAELAVGVDADHDGKVTWGELRAAGPQIAGYLQQHLGLAAQGSACELTTQAMLLNDRVDGAYVWVPLTARCSSEIERLTIRYSLMDGIDPSHRGLLTLNAGDAVQTAVLDGNTAQAAFAVFAPSKWRAFKSICTRAYGTS
jgi:hypothetical protein